MTEKQMPIRGLLAIESKIVLERLGKMQPGELVSYDELNQLTKSNVRQRRNVLTTPIKKLLNEQSKVFIAERGKGIRMLRNEEIPALGTRDVSRVGRIARRSIRTLSAVNFTELPDDKKISHNTSLTILSLVQRGSTAKSVKMIEDSVKKQSNPLPMGETLRLFSGS